MNVEKLQTGRRQMADRCRNIAAEILAEAGVEIIEHHNSGLRGRAWSKIKKVSIPVPTTRRRLYIVAHEAAHVELEHIGKKPKHRQEYEAERRAHELLRKHGIVVSRKDTIRAKKYVAHKIRQAIKRGAKNIDKESLMWCQSEWCQIIRQFVENMK